MDDEAVKERDGLWVSQARPNRLLRAERQMSRNQVDKAVAEITEKGLARAVERPIPGANALSRLARKEET
jgi:hypothetical protein